MLGIVRSAIRSSNRFVIDLYKKKKKRKIRCVAKFQCIFRVDSDIIGKRVVIVATVSSERR